MNISDGGKQPRMRDTQWNGKVQKMTLDDGQQKGMKRVLMERGVDIKGMNASKMREELAKFSDFCNYLEEAVKERGHLCLFLPCFHCELNPIERCWCYAKKYTRAHCNGSIVRLRKIVPEGLATVSKELISRYFLTCKDFEKGHTCNTVDNVVTFYKSHRRVF